jgi:Domain of unknown function (DUF382)
VPVPRHWSQKRKYLQGKRGIEKPAFQLPDFIEATGISEMRRAYAEKEDAKRLKQKQRDKTRPGMGKLDIDYQARWAAPRLAPPERRGCSWSCLACRIGYLDPVIVSTHDGTHGPRLTAAWPRIPAVPFLGPGGL